MFEITRGQGFWLAFPNGWGVSVQFGPGNYGDHYRESLSDRNEPGGPGHAAWSGGSYTSDTAEVAAIHTDGRWFDFNKGEPGRSGPVLAYQTPAQVAAVIARIAAL